MFTTVETAHILFTQWMKRKKVKFVLCCTDSDLSKIHVCSRHVQMLLLSQTLLQLMLYILCIQIVNP